MDDDISRILAGGDAPAAPLGPSDDSSLLVSKHILGGAPVLFVFRDDAEEEGDSGWTLLSGTESDEQMGDLTHFEVQTVGWALDRAPVLAAIFAAPAGSCFERDVDKAPWVELVDG